MLEKEAADMKNEMVIKNLRHSEQFDVDEQIDGEYELLTVDIDECSLEMSNNLSSSGPEKSQEQR
jgi:hypothetical protein